MQVEFLECVFIFDSTLIQLLLNACLSDGSVSNIIELSNQKVVDVSMHIILHDVVDSCNLLLERKDVVHEPFADFLVLDLDDQALILINLLIKLLDLLIDGFTILLRLRLQFLNEIEELLLDKDQL